MDIVRQYFQEIIQGVNNNVIGGWTSIGLVLLAILTLTLLWRALTIRIPKDVIGVTTDKNGQPTNKTWTPGTHFCLRRGRVVHMRIAGNDRFNVWSTDPVSMGRTVVLRWTLKDADNGHVDMLAVREVNHLLADAHSFTQFAFDGLARTREITTATPHAQVAQQLQRDLNARFGRHLIFHPVTVGIIYPS